MSQKVAQRKVIYIRHDLSVSSKWDEKINLSFTPDELIVRQIGYRAGTETLLYSLYSNIIHDSYLGCFYDASMSTPGTTYKMGNQLAGSYEFRVDGTLGTNTTICQGVLVIVLEFVKY